MFRNWSLPRAACSAREAHTRLSLSRRERLVDGWLPPDLPTVQSVVLPSRQGTHAAKPSLAHNRATPPYPLRQDHRAALAPRGWAGCCHPRCLNCHSPGARRCQDRSTARSCPAAPHRCAASPPPPEPRHRQPTDEPQVAQVAKPPAPPRRAFATHASVALASMRNASRSGTDSAATAAVMLLAASFRSVRTIIASFNRGAKLLPKTTDSSRHIRPPPLCASTLVRRVWHHCGGGGSSATHAIIADTHRLWSMAEHPRTGI